VIWRSLFCVCWCLVYTNDCVKTFWKEKPFNRNHIFYNQTFLALILTRNNCLLKILRIYCLEFTFTKWKWNINTFPLTIVTVIYFFERWFQYQIPQSQKQQNATPSKANLHNIKNPFHQNPSPNLENWDFPWSDISCVVISNP